MTQGAQYAASNPSTPTGRVSVGSALFISLIVVVGLGALAFWPTAAWAPPKRPALSPPIVFDEFVNSPSPSSDDSSIAEPVAR